MPISSESIVGSLTASIDSAKPSDKPYKNWFLTNCLPADAAAAVIDLPFEAPARSGGSRASASCTMPRANTSMSRTARSSPSARRSARLSRTSASPTRSRGVFGSRLGGTYLRVEYAQDTDSFWLEPHTDLGVKMFTMLLYMSKNPQHRTLGTDIYDKDKKHVGASPFAPNAAMVFVPSDITYHGFEPRKIEGVRKSVIINYVTNEWRAREQLAFPDQPIGG